MTLEPLFSASSAIQIHVATVVPAFLIGTWQIFFSTKGAPYHRALGYLYMALMAVTSVAALFIHEIMPESPFFGFSPIHLLVPITLVSIVGAIYGARTRNIALHRGSMWGVYVGGILVAGALAFMPGRVMHQMVFG
jgi:uncharacterized membrane protein